MTNAGGHGPLYASAVDCGPTAALYFALSAFMMTALSRIDAPLVLGVLA